MLGVVVWPETVSRSCYPYHQYGAAYIYTRHRKVHTTVDFSSNPDLWKRIGFSKDWPLPKELDRWEYIL